MFPKKKIFSCHDCGNPYEAYPPDDQHTTASLEEPKDASGTVVKIIHDCEKCKAPMALYWYRPKISFRIA